MRPTIWQARAGAAACVASQGRMGEAAVKQRDALAMIDEIAGLFTEEKLRTLYVKSATSKAGILPQTQLVR